jgi:ATP-binding cassette subfamily F protein uup
VKPTSAPTPAAAPKPASKPAAKKSGLSFTEKHRLDTLPGEIARLEAEIGKLTELLADPDLFTREPVKFRKATEALSERQARLSAAEDEWLALEEKASA